MTGTPRRTDPKTFAVRAITLATQLVVPLVLVGVALLDEGKIAELIAYYLPFVVLAVGAQFALAYLRWARLTYTVGAEDIRVESGVLSRSARSVPYERIQDVSLEQQFVPRLFGLVEVKFETGAGGGEDLALAYVDESEGERLRDVVRRGQTGSPPLAVADTPEEESRLLFAMSPKRVLTFGLFEFSLVVVAAGAGAAQQFDFLLGFDWWEWKEWRARLDGPGEWLLGLGQVAQVVLAALGVAIFALLGIVTGLVRTALRDWGFRLERTERGLRRRRGLLTRTDLVMPVHRVQALGLGTGIVRRLFGWHSLKLVSLASDSGSANHEALPFARLHEIAPVVAETEFDLPSADTDWHRSATAFRVDRTILGASGLLGISVVALALGQWWALIGPAAGGLAIAMHEYLRWRWDRHALDARQIYTREGWFAPRLAIAAREKLQSVEVVQSPLARRRGYADLHLGLAGGRLRMRGVAVKDARAMREALLDSMARRDFSALVGDVETTTAAQVRRADLPILDDA